MGERVVVVVVQFILNFVDILRHVFGICYKMLEKN